MATGLFWLLAWALGPPVAALLYGPKHEAAGSLLVILGLMPIVFGVNLLLMTALRALEDPKSVLKGDVVAALTACTAGAGLVFAAGVVGAAWGITLSYLVAIIPLSLSLRSAHRQRRHMNHAGSDDSRRVST